MVILLLLPLPLPFRVVEREGPEIMDGDAMAMQLGWKFLGCLAPSTQHRIESGAGAVLIRPLSMSRHVHGRMYSVWGAEYMYPGPFHGCEKLRRLPPCTLHYLLFYEIML